MLSVSRYGSATARFTERRIFLLTQASQLQQLSLRARDVRAVEIADSVVVEEAVAARIQRDNLKHDIQIPLRRSQ